MQVCFRVLLAVNSVKEGATAMKKILYRLEDLQDYIVRFFRHYQVPEADARIVADVLTAADLRGVESHGIIRLDTYYGSQIRRGMIDPQSPVKIINETAAVLAIDGGYGLGHVVGHHAMQRCIEKARDVGVCMATVRNSNHYGIAGYYAMMALPHDMIGISFTNAQPLVAPTYGRTAILGTNPIAVAAPAGENLPYVLDMATSIVPIGRITVYQKAGRPIPEGWGVDQDGLITTDPSAVLQGGALMALGGTDIMRGYKGYGLALLVEILTGVLAGGAFASAVEASPHERPARMGHCFIAIRPEIFRPLEDFYRDMEALIREIKESPKAEGRDRIYIHGEKSFERAERSLRAGVPVMAGVVRSLVEEGQAAGVPFDLESLGEIEETNY
jgi:L-2-hydroxycarboxylate dehydrogenase (NAD+)